MQKRHVVAVVFVVPLLFTGCEGRSAASGSSSKRAASKSGGGSGLLGMFRSERVVLPEGTTLPFLA
jgi:hypothetical protein